MNDAESRRYPQRPILAASVAVFRGGKVLLAKRVNPPAAQRFSLPGGLVDIGEPVAQAALRELREETGVEAEIVCFNDHVEVVERDGDGRVERHFVVASFIGNWRAGDGNTGPEASQIAWVDPAAVRDMPTTPDLVRIIDRAVRILAQA